MICPDCKGKKVIELWASVVPCEKCNGLGTVADPVAAESFAPADWKPDEPKTFDPVALPPLYQPIDTAALRNSDFGDGCYLGVSQGRDPVLRGSFPMQPVLEAGVLYQVNPRAAEGQKFYRPLGKELICTIDGYSNRERWADLHFYYENRTSSIVRMNGDTMQRQACLMAIGVRGSHLYRVRPFKLGDTWEITIEGYDRQHREWMYGMDYQAIDRVARDRAMAKVSADFFKSGLGQPHKSIFFDVPKGLGKTEYMKKIMERVARPDEVHEYPFAKTVLP